MKISAVLDTGFLISLVDCERPCHETAKQYYKYCLENQIDLLLPTVAVSEFAIKQSPDDLPLRNFIILPFCYQDAKRCAALNVSYYRTKLSNTGQRDSVKDDFKIIAQAEERKAQYLISEDENTFKVYVDQLRADYQIRFSFISIQQKFDVALINGTGQAEMDLKQ
jgi:hypothetical protein